MIDPDRFPAVPDAAAALEREHEVLQAILREEVAALGDEVGRRLDEIVLLTRWIEAAEAAEAALALEAAALGDEVGRRLDEIVLLTRRIEAAEAALALEAALGRARLRRAAGLPRELPSPRAQARALADTPLFDAAAYRAALPAGLPRRVAPERHYVETGAFEGLDPGPNFSTRSYYAANPDVLEAGWPALVHYALHGRTEGRPIRPAEGGPAHG